MRERIYTLLEALAVLHAPSGQEQEMDTFLISRLSPQVHTWQDEAGNIIVHLPGLDPSRKVALSAHKDEIGMIVQSVAYDGRLRVGRLGGAFPWIYGEGMVDILGQHKLIQGVLSFGSRHVSHQSPQKAQQLDKPLTWDNAWIETLLSPEALADAGVGPGTRVVVGRMRKQPVRLGSCVASYALDNKAAVAVLILLAETIKQPQWDLYLIFSAQEEVGALGALYFTHRHPINELIALEVTPMAPEYPLIFNDHPVLIQADSYSYYDLGLTRRLEIAAQKAQIPLQSVVLSGFGSDGSLTVKSGHVAQTACLGFPTLNTHGYEITSLGSLAGIFTVLQAYLDPGVC